MINHTRKLLCLHIEKCGGTSLDKVLREQCNFPLKPYSRIHWPLSRHIRRWVSEGKNILDDYFKFCVVRNPWDRLVSQYFYYRGDGDVKKFQEWIVGQSYTNHRYPFWPMVRHTQFGDKLNCMDFVIKFESFQQDFNVVCDKIGIPHQELPHYNKTKHKPYWEYYDEETKELVDKLYVGDIDTFGYKFGGMIK